MYDVCYVNAQGELQCGPQPIEIKSGLDSVRTAIMGAGVDIPPNKLDLIMQLINQVLVSPLDDACTLRRTDDTVGSVQQILAAQPPLMLLYRYFALPGNIMATYYLQQHNYVAAYGAVTHWSTLKAGC